MLTYKDVPGYFDFENLYERAVSRAPDDGAKFVEVGVLFGKSTLFMADEIRASRKPIAFDAVDVFGWGGEGLHACLSEIEKAQGPVSEEWRHLFRSVSTWDFSPDSLALHKALVWTTLENAGLQRFVRLISNKGQARAEAYQDASLDFVFIDTQHGYEDTKTMLDAFIPKIRMGGVIAGHDAACPGVVRAAREVLDPKYTEISKSSFWCEL